MTTRLLPKLASIGLCVFAIAASAVAAGNDEAVQSLVIVANGENVGHLEIRSHNATLDVDYYVDNNGRGPKHHETVKLGDDAIPTSWSVEGTSLMGSKVAEHYQWKDGLARWNSEADNGGHRVSAPMLYVTNESSPGAVWVYARALLAAPDHELDVLPSGRMHLERVGAIEVKAPDSAQPVEMHLFRLLGLALEPHYLMLDASGELFADIDGGVVAIRDGYQASVPEVLEAVQEKRLVHAQTLQARLSHDVADGLWIRDVHVFDPVTGQRGDLVNVHIKNGHVISVDTEWRPEPGERAYDGAGGTVIPGLHDMHSHSTLLSGLWYLAAGVTSTRDMGNRNGFLLDLVNRIEHGDIAGPRIVRNGFLEGRSPYSARMGRVADSLSDALDSVRWYQDHGYWQIKIYNSMKPAWVAPIADLAHSLGMTVTGHVPAFTNADAMLESGYDEIAHVNQLMLGWVLKPGEDTRTPLRLTAMKRVADLDLDAPEVRHTLALMRQQSTALNTTAVILERLMLSRSGTVLDADRSYLSHMPATYQRYRKRTYVSDLTPKADAQYQKAFQKVLRLVGKLHQQGTPLLPGTDDTTGFTVHRELELYVKAGLTPAEALSAATWKSEVYLGRTDCLGRVRPGRQADVVLLPKNPVADISAVRTPSLVVKGGQLYLPAEIYKALGVEPFAVAPKKLQ